MNKSGLIKSLAVIFLLFLCCQPLLASEDFEHILSLKEAVSLAAERNNHIKALKKAIDVAAGTKAQAARLPNPELAIGFDEFGGSGQFAGTAVIKSSVGLAQTIVTAGKTRNKRRLAESDLQIARLDAGLGLLELQMNTARFFIHVYFMQKLVELASQSADLTRLATESISRSVAAGEKPAIDETSAMVELSTAEAHLRQQLRELEIARTDLAATWNCSHAEFSAVTLNADQIDITPYLDSAVASESLQLYPGLAIAEEQVTRESRALKLSKSEASPDMTMAARVSRFRETGEQACEVELSFPLQVFDRNSANIRANKAALEKAQFEKKAFEVTLNARITRLHSQIESIGEELANIRNGLIRLAERAELETQKAYEAGERDFHELLDAKRALIDANKTELTLKCDLLQHICELAFLTGSQENLFHSLSTLSKEATIE